MTAEHDEQLEQALTELTTWHGPEPQLWKRALADAGSATDRQASRFAWLLHDRLSARVAACIIVVALGITIAVNLPHLGLEPVAMEPRTSPDGLAEKYEVVNTSFAPEDAGVRELDAATMQQFEALDYLAYDASSEPEDDSPANRGGGARFGAGYGPGRAGPAGAFSTAAPSGDLPSEARQIVRKATIELRTTDVRTAFLKAALLINEATGEYVQESSITGRDDNIRANLTLRVAADRLSFVLNELRELGEVDEEQVTGQDVTTQVIDVEARLRNEQRIETELLELLEKRKDAPLKEILELRQSLGHVRQQIERLTAQRQHLGRLVSLATVLVIIRAADTPDEPTDFSIGAYYGNGIRTAWRKGLVFLADTSGVLLSVIVGGLIWWILLVLAFVAVRHYRRRTAGSPTK